MPFGQQSKRGAALTLRSTITVSWSEWSRWVLHWGQECRCCLIDLERWNTNKRRSGCHFLVLDFLGSGFWELFWISQNPHFLARKFPRTLTNFIEPKKNTTRLRTSCCVARATWIVLCQKHDYIVLLPTWHRRTTIDLIKFELLKKIKNSSLSGLLTQPKCYKIQNSLPFWTRVCHSISRWVFDLILWLSGQSSSAERADSNGTMQNNVAWILMELLLFDWASYLSFINLIAWIWP
jgi:hypothetical protein